MSKILLYVDAENVSFERASQFFAEAHATADAKDVVIGKCYGRKEHLGSAVRDYVELGFEYVDSSVFTELTKNITDMKLITDCVYDVFGLYKGDIKAIYILSDDCDFNPLINKLRSVKFDLNAPTMSINEKLNNSQMLTRALRIRKFYPLDSSIIYSNLFDDIKHALLGLDYEERLIERYLGIRIKKLYNYLSQNFDVESPKLTTEYIRAFNFRVFYEDVANSNFDLEKLITLFTTKMFGETLKSSDILIAMREINNWKGVTNGA